MTTTTPAISNFRRGSAARHGAALLALACAANASAGTLQPLTQQPPDVVGLPFLLTDGTVLAQGTDLSTWWRLTPDDTGSYVNGSWTRAASIPYAWNYAPYAFASAVLADGRLLIEGGEYNENGPFSLTAKGAVYDPVRDRWSPVAPPDGWNAIGDASSIVMPNGKFLLGDKLGTRIAELDPKTMTWTALGAAGKNDDNAEEGWTLLPDGSILTVDVRSPPAAERYVYTDAADAGHWVSAGNTPQSLAFNYGVPLQPFNFGSYDPPGETGICMLRPNRTVFCSGASDDTTAHIAHSAVYSIDANSWHAGPDFPVGDDSGDTSAVLLPNGNVLMSAVSGTLYEFDGTSLLPQAHTVPGLLLDLPSGEALLVSTLQSGTLPDVEVYRPDGPPDPAWAPTIANAAATLQAGATYPISGTQFNGLSQAQAFGDELVGPTNYPLVRITNLGSGHVAYAHTHDHSSMGVATGSSPVSTNFDVPRTIESGPSTLEVVANGIASAPVSVTVAATPAPFALGPGISGSWYDPAQNGHGFDIEVLQTDPPQLALFWFVDAPAGGMAWIGGSGPIDGDHATVAAYQVAGSGALFPPAFDPVHVAAQSWGSITVAFSACDTGQVTWNSTTPGYGVGTLPLKRLTQLAGTTCQ